MMVLTARLLMSISTHTVEYAPLLLISAVTFSTSIPILKHHAYTFMIYNFNFKT